MPDHDVSRAATTEGLPVAPSLGPTLDAAQVPPQSTLVDRRVVVMCGLAVSVGVIAALAAQALMRMIGLFTNISFFGRMSTAPVSPAGHHLGLFVVLVPIVGAVIVGFMARYGSKAIRGHGIPEAMEQVLVNQSRIPARVTFLKPVSAAISIGTGGPFGAEGPIIATGGALGSLVGQVLSTTGAERKMLLAAGAAAGMAATFGSPVSAVLLAIELLLFEFRPRSLIPVGLASVTATGVRIAFEGTQPVFAMSDIGQPSGAALAIYILLGAAIGVAAVYVTRAVYAIEDAFARLPIHWMWWPAIGAVAVGVTGYFVPRTLGVGYDNIADVLSNTLALPLVAILCVAKFISWSIALGSGTSGGTLAPLFTIGGSLGALLGAALQRAIPAAGVDPRIAALVGMAAIFAGASRAMLTSVVFAFETTRQPLGLLPLLGGCTASYLISCLLMRHSIMTEKIARRGVRVPAEYSADVLEQVLVAEVANPSVVTLRADAILERVRTWIASGAHGSGHQGFPVLDETGVLIGVVTRRDLLPSTGDQSEAARPLPDQAVRTLLRRPPVIVYADCSLREAVDHMVKHDVGRLPVVARETRALVGIITRSDVLSAHRRRLEEGRRDAPDIRLSRPNIDATQQRPA